MKKLSSDWEIVDEGEMTDMLGIEVKYDDDNSITLHLSKYIGKMLDKFNLKKLSNVQRYSLPYSLKILEHVVSALSNSTADEPLRYTSRAHPSFPRTYRVILVRQW